MIRAIIIILIIVQTSFSLQLEKQRRLFRYWMKYNISIGTIFMKQTEKDQYLKKKKTYSIYII